MGELTPPQRELPTVSQSTPKPLPEILVQDQQTALIPNTHAKTEISFVEAVESPTIAKQTEDIPVSDAQAKIQSFNPDKKVSGANADFYFINGICNSEEDAKDTAAKLSHLIGHPVKPVYSPTDGLFADIHEAMKMDIASEKRGLSKHTNIQLMHDIHSSMLADKNVKIIAHSRGTAELANVLWSMRDSLSLYHSEEQINQYFSKIEVVTMGALASPSAFPADVKLTQITNPYDIVPKLAGGKINLDRERYSKAETEKTKLTQYTPSSKEYMEGLLNKTVTVAALTTKHVIQPIVNPSFYVAQPNYMAINIGNALGSVKRAFSEHPLSMGDSNYLGQKNVQDFFAEFGAP